jgi:hypothetical protein
LRRLAELRRTEEVDRASEIGVVEDIEELRAVTKLQLLGKVKLPLQNDEAKDTTVGANRLAPAQILALPSGNGAGMNFALSVATKAEC